MSRKYNESPKPVRCVDCDGFCPFDACLTHNSIIEDPEKYRYCKDFEPQTKPAS